jgi:hypothetical protein
MLGAILDVATLLLAVRSKLWPSSVSCIGPIDANRKMATRSCAPIATLALRKYFGAFFFGVSSAASPSSSSPNISRRNSRHVAGVTGVTGANAGVGMIRTPAYVKATRNSGWIVSWEGCRHV